MVGEYLAYRRVAGLEDGVLLRLLRRVCGVCERRERDALPYARRIGDGTPDIAGGLRLQRLELICASALECEGDESYAKPPDVVLLRRSVELDGEDVLGKVAELREERLAVDAVFVDEAEVGVVQDDYDLLPGVGRRLDGVSNVSSFAPQASPKTSA